jgi:acyl-CoA synthetase (AMP-forming)/AMP-acid ligase II/acyl carrier protein
VKAVPTQVMSKEETVVDVLRWRAAERPEQTALTFLEDGESPSHTLTYDSLDRRAREIAVSVRKTVRPRERVLLLHPPGLEFVAAFFGCLYAGVVPVPVYPPGNPRHFARLEAIVADAEAHCVLTQSDFRGRLSSWLKQRGGRVSLMCTDQLLGEPGDRWKRETDSTPETIAFLQYTSGSTDQPKGVMVTHANLMANQRMIQQAFGHSEGLVVVSWLPIYHDMGLIGSLMQPLFLGGHCVLMSPAAFLQKPRRWLAAISSFRAQASGGPNFALRLCIKMVQGEQKAGLDLSALDVLFCGSEPINAADLEEFAAAFRESGFRREALYACYGMAEATLLATGGTPGAGPVIEVVDADALARNIASSPAGDSTCSRRAVVGCGKAVDGEVVVIVDSDHAGAETDGREAHRALEDGQVGEIWLRGPNVARGYWRKPELTRETFDGRLTEAASADGGPYLRTGDLGFLRNGELFVTGRIKDLIIIRGRNHYPHDIELTTQNCHPAFRATGGAAFSVPSEGEERLIIVQEIDRHHHHEARAATALIRAAIVEEYEITPHAVVVVRQSGVPKTSSGKIQRRACARAYLEGSLPVVYEWREIPIVAETRPIDVLHARSREDIEDFLVQKLCSGLGISSDDMDVSQPFSSFGLDSLRAVSLLDEVATWLGRSLSPTLFWDYPTISALAAHLADEIPESTASEGRG